jgi:IclR family acetate operon transcriptional repressor
MTDNAGTSGVQSLHRALGVIETIADAGGHLTLQQIADATNLPPPTVHRILKTLVERGYMRQLPDRRYALGFRFVPLGAAANRLVGVGAERILGELVRELGETANLAILAGDRAEYVAQVPSTHSMRMFTQVGRRVDLHATGVGKALLAQLADEDVKCLVLRTGLAPHTPRTIISESELRAALARIRDSGYAIDNEEQELGVRCVAVTLPAPMLVGTALSISGPLTRMDDALIARAVPLLHAAALRLVDS